VGMVLPKLLPDGRRTRFYSAWSLDKRQPQAYRQDLVAVLSVLVDGSIQPVLARTMPLGEAAAAQRLLEDGSVTGKIVLTTSAPGRLRRARTPRCAAKRVTAQSQLRTESNCCRRRDMAR
jgi:Zinc-binding dehydrogenase